MAKRLGALARSIAVAFMLMAIGSLFRGPVFSQAAPLLAVRSTGPATLGVGTKAQVYDKAKAEAIRNKWIEHD